MMAPAPRVMRSAPEPLPPEGPPAPADVVAPAGGLVAAPEEGLPAAALAKAPRVAVPNALFWVC